MPNFVRQLKARSSHFLSFFVAGGEDRAAANSLHNGHLDLLVLSDILPRESIVLPLHFSPLMELNI